MTVGELMLRDLQADCLKVLEGQCWRCGGRLDDGDCPICRCHMETWGQAGKLALLVAGIGREPRETREYGRLRLEAGER
jgi:hypothetical protein